jgi:hypothetical protein
MELAIVAEKDNRKRARGRGREEKRRQEEIEIAIQTKETIATQPNARCINPIDNHLNRKQQYRGEHCQIDNTNKSKRTLINPMHK